VIKVGGGTNPATPLETNAAPAYACSRPGEEGNAKKKGTGRNGREVRCMAACPGRRLNAAPRLALQSAEPADRGLDVDHRPRGGWPPIRSNIEIWCRVCPSAERGIRISSNAEGARPQCGASHSSGPNSTVAPFLRMRCSTASRSDCDTPSAITASSTECGCPSQFQAMNHLTRYVARSRCPG
jgi:hypothetical protein